MMDAVGFWKAARDANMEAWSKLMVDMVNSDEYAKATGTALQQFLAMTQPSRDATRQSMTQTLATMNMPSRTEVLSIAERLVNVEVRLDDLDAKLNNVQRAIQEATRETIRQALETPDRKLDAIQTRLNGLDATVRDLLSFVQDVARPAPNAPERPSTLKTAPLHQVNGVEPGVVQAAEVVPVDLGQSAHAGGRQFSRKAKDGR